MHKAQLCLLAFATVVSLGLAGCASSGVVAVAPKKFDAGKTGQALSDEGKGHTWAVERLERLLSASRGQGRVTPGLQLRDHATSLVRISSLVTDTMPWELRPATCSPAIPQ